MIRAKKSESKDRRTLIRKEVARKSAKRGLRKGRPFHLGKSFFKQTLKEGFDFVEDIFFRKQSTVLITLNNYSHLFARWTNTELFSELSFSTFFSRKAFQFYRDKFFSFSKTSKLRFSIFYLYSTALLFYISIESSLGNKKEDKNTQKKERETMNQGLKIRFFAIFWYSIFEHISNQNKLCFGTKEQKK